MGRRELTEAQKRFIQRNGKHLTLIWQPFLLGLLFVALGAPGTFGFEVPLPDGVALVDSETGQPSAPLGVFFWIGLGIFVLAGVFNVAWNRLARSKAGVFVASDLRTTLTEGDVKRASVVGTFTDHTYKHGPYFFNVVVLDLGTGQQMYLGVFSDRAFVGLQPGGMIDVYYTPRVPRLAIPVSLVGNPG